MKVRRKGIISCKEASFLVSKREDVLLPVHDRLRLKLHLFVCRPCRRFAKQIYWISIFSIYVNFPWSILLVHYLSRHKRPRLEIILLHRSCLNQEIHCWNFLKLLDIYQLLSYNKLWQKKCYLRKSASAVFLFLYRKEYKIGSKCGLFLSWNRYWICKYKDFISHTWKKQAHYSSHSRKAFISF